MPDENIKQAAFDFVSRVENGDSEDEYLQHLPDDPEARAFALDLITMKSFRRVTRNSRAIKRLFGALVIVAMLATVGAAHAVTLDLGETIVGVVVVGALGGLISLVVG